MRKPTPISFQLIWDGYGLSNRNTGVYTYARCLLNHLVSMNVRPLIFGDPSAFRNFSHFGIDTARVKRLPILGQSKVVWSMQTSRELKKYLRGFQSQEKVIYHGLSNINLPFLYGARANSKLKFVLTVHDVIPLLEGAGVSSFYKIQFQYLLPKVLKMADAIVCVSEWTQHSLIERFPEIAFKTQVIPNGYDLTPTLYPEEWKGSSDEERSLNLFQDSKLRLLCVSRFEGYKRLSIVLEILKKKAIEYTVVLVTDPKGIYFFERNAREFLASGSLRIATGLSPQALDRLYETCELVIHPSLYEGFCLPAVEALNHQKPIVFCRGSAIDTTVASGKTGVSVARDASVEEWTSAIQDALDLKKTPQFSQNLQIFLAERPTWKDSALRLKGLYNSI